MDRAAGFLPGGDPGGSTYLGSSRISEDGAGIHDRYSLPRVSGPRDSWRPVWEHVLANLPPGESADTWLRRGRRFLLCGQDEGPHYVYQCPDCGDHVLVAQTCSMKACPECQTVLQLRWRRGIEALMAGAKERGRRLRHLVLTVPSEPLGGLARQVAFFDDSLRRLRQRKSWRERVYGAVIVYEVTYREAGWHLHAHILFEGEYWPWELVSREWVRVTDGVANPAGVSITATDPRKAADYAAKGMDPFYLVKGMGQLVGVPVLAEFILATWKVKFYREWGIACGMLPPRDRLPLLCPRCGGNFLHRIACVWGEENALRYIEETREKAQLGLLPGPLAEGGADGG